MDEYTHIKETADGQAQLDVGGEAVNNLIAREAHRKILDLAIFSCQEGTSASNRYFALLV